MQPLRCWTCGRGVHGITAALERASAEGISVADVLDDMAVSQYCCRRFALCDPGMIDIRAKTSVSSRHKDAHKDATNDTDIENES